jgi:glycosyltransferase involved in cell wall biosynthesis
MMRILHVVGSLNRGGAETWLAQVYRAMDRLQYSFDFLVHSPGPFDYESEVRALGANMISCEGIRNPMQYAVNLSRVLRKYGPYDCIHSHVHLFSGYVMAVAAMNRVPLRIVQSHTNSSFSEQRFTLAKRSYAKFMRGLISLAANRRVAVSQAAGDSLFGNVAGSARAWSYLPLGIDLEPYREPVDRKTTRDEFGLADDSIAIFHVGRFSEPKNHAFMLEIAANLCAIEPRARFFLVGDGPLRARIQDQARSRNLDEHVQFLGIRKDIPRLLLGAADLFLFPSLYEGLGLVHVEAQVAGLCSIVSDVVPAEADILPKQVVRLPLRKGAAVWAHSIATAARCGVKNKPLDLGALDATISIEASARHLTNLYSHCMVQTLTKSLVPAASR